MGHFKKVVKMFDNKDNIQSSSDYCSDGNLFGMDMSTDAGASVDSMLRLKMLNDVMGNGHSSDRSLQKTMAMMHMMQGMTSSNNDSNPMMQMMMMRTILGGGDRSLNTAAMMRLIKQLTGQVNLSIIHAIMDNESGYDNEMLLIFVNLLHYSAEEITDIIEMAEKISKNQLSVTNLMSGPSNTDQLTFRTTVAVVSNLIKNKNVNLKPIIHNIITYKSGHIDLSTLIGLWLQLDSFKLAAKSNPVKKEQTSDIDHMAILRDNLTDVDNHSINELAREAFKAEDQNKDRDKELLILKKEIVASLGKRIKKYLSNADGQLVVRNLLNNADDQITITALIALNEMEISLDFVRGLFEEKDGVYKISTTVETFESDYKDSDFSKKFIASLDKYNAVFELINEAIKTIETNRENEEKQKQKEKQDLQKLEEQRMEVLNDKIIEAAIKDLKESGVYEQIIKKVKEDLKADIQS